MARILSGIQPTGTTHLGNYLGALRHWVDQQDEFDSFFSIVDLHAITVHQDPKDLREAVTHLAAMLFAVGIDPQRATVFLQSHVPGHAQLAWIMECTASFGELSRMTQFKEKSTKTEFISAGLFNYPALMAADILLYQAERVPVGDDQKQHLELARTLATRFNTRFGEVFTVPEPQIPKVGARIMDLQVPTQKMSKSSSQDSGIIYLLDPPELIKKKISRAVTDSANDLRYVLDDPLRAGLRNLLELGSSLLGASPEEVASRHSSYGALKVALSEIVIEAVTPIQQLYREYTDDRGELLRILGEGAERANAVARATIERAHAALGFLT